MPQIHNLGQRPKRQRRRGHLDSEPYSLSASILEFLGGALLWVPRLIVRGWRARFEIGHAT
jgi:hypothetical protein